MSCWQVSSEKWEFIIKWEEIKVENKIYRRGGGAGGNNSLDESSWFLSSLKSQISKCGGGVRLRDMNASTKEKKTQAQDVLKLQKTSEFVVEA